jgi:hypothetical protein
MPRQTAKTLSAWRDRPNEHPIANLISGDAVTQLVDDPHRLVADDQPWTHGILATKNVQVCPADGGERNANDRFTWPRIVAENPSASREYGVAFVVLGTKNGRSGLLFAAKAGLSFREEV